MITKEQSRHVKKELKAIETKLFNLLLYIEQNDIEHDMQSEIELYDNLEFYLWLADNGLPN